MALLAEDSQRLVACIQSDMNHLRAFSYEHALLRLQPIPQLGFCQSGEHLQSWLIQALYPNYIHNGLFQYLLSIHNVNALSKAAYASSLKVVDGSQPHGFHRPDR